MSIDSINHLLNEVYSASYRQRCPLWERHEQTTVLFQRIISHAHIIIVVIFTIKSQ